MSWDDEAATWDEGVLQRAYAAAAFESLQEKALGRAGLAIPGARICDFGCGTGLLTERLADLAAHIDGVDISTGMLAVLDAKASRNGWQHVHTHRAVPPGGAPYDLVVCSSVCAFLEDYPGAVRTLVQRLRPGGLFVQWDWELDPTEAEPMGLSRAQIRAALDAAGLQQVVVDTGFEVTVEGRTMRPLMGSGQTPTV